MKDSSPVQRQKLSVLKESLLEERLRGRLPAKKPTNGFIVQPRPHAIPLSYPQQRLWLIEQLEGSAAAQFNVLIAARLKGTLNEKALERAINTIIERHESLRTRFAVADGNPVQIIVPHVRVSIPVQDLRHLSAEEQDRETRAALEREVDQPF